MAINVDAASPQTDSWLTTISDSLAIPGNGAKLVGNPTFVSSGGVVYDKFNVDQYKVPPSDFLTQPAFSFAKVAGGGGISIDQLGIDGLNGYLQLGNDSTATLRGQRHAIR